MAFNGNALFVDVSLKEKNFILRKQNTFFLQKLTQYNSMIEVYIKIK